MPSRRNLLYDTSRYSSITALGSAGHGGVKGSEVLKGRKAGDIMKTPYSVSPDDTVSTARAVMRETSISSVVVVSGSRAAGIVGVLDLLSPLVMGEVGRRGGMFFDRNDFEGVNISSFMRKDVPRVQPETPLGKVIDMMVESRSAVVVEKGGKLAGVVTPTDILKLMGTERKGVYVNITGIREEDDFLKSVIDEEISNSMSKLAKILPLEWLAVHVERYFEQGRRKKYSVRCRLITGKGVFVSGGHAWDLTKAFRQALSRIEREVISRKERKLI